MKKKNEENEKSDCSFSLNSLNFPLKNSLHTNTNKTENKINTQNPHPNNQNNHQNNSNSNINSNSSSFSPSPPSSSSSSSWIQNKVLNNENQLTNQQLQRFYFNENSISSRGCSRVFIVLILKEALNYCQSLSHSPDFPFRNNLVKMWLVKVKNDCISSSPFPSSSSSCSNFPCDSPLNLNLYNPQHNHHQMKDFCFFGGTEFSSNPSSYWTEPKQFFTWWKNNIERKNKFQNIIHDSETFTNEKSLFR